MANPVLDNYSYWIELIPEELKRLDQWVICNYPNKKPLNPRTFREASATNPKDWGSFEEAKRTQCIIGFVLTKNDPYCVVDLDVKDDTTPESLLGYKELINDFDSYTETSISGRGVHILCLAETEKGYHTKACEIYSDKRYIIMTGACFNGRPIIDCQSKILKLISFLGADRPPINTTISEESNLSDEKLVEIATNAANGSKFTDLCNGDYEKVLNARGEYLKSASEADVALIAIIGFYTRDIAQIKRIFAMSALGKRDKWQKRFDDLFERAYQTACGTTLVESQIVNTVPARHPTVDPELIIAADPGQSIEYPPNGLVKDLAHYIESASYKPVPEASIIAALGLMAGLCGRCYNVSDSGLNMYFLLVARTGTGKESMQSGIERLVTAIRPTVPSIDQFIGPSAFGSGQGLIRRLDKSHSFVSVLGEFGLSLRSMCDQKAASHLIFLKKALLDCYTKSGAHQILRETAYSDVTKNTAIVRAPALTLIGETTPGTFYDTLTAEHVAEGLIPRFHIVEYQGERPHSNRRPQPPPKELLDHLIEITTKSLELQSKDETIPIVFESQTVIDYFNWQEDRIDQFIRDAKDNEVIREVWNRAHLKMLRVAGLIAVGVDHMAPVITLSIAQWASKYIEQGTRILETRFNNHDYGSGDERAIADVRRVIGKYQAMSVDDKRRNKIPDILIANEIIPHRLIQTRCANLTSFKQDKKGSINLLKSVLETLCSNGELDQVNPAQYGLKGRCYKIK